MARSALDRFLSFCQFEAHTGCVVWMGARTAGRGDNIPYGAFWFEGRKWFAHRWAAKHIHGLDIAGLQVDHCCPHRAIPNSLCVEHVQAVTLIENVLLQHERRKRFIYLQVGLLQYTDVYGPQQDEDDNDIPFHTQPSWLPKQGLIHDACPF